MGYWAKKAANKPTHQAPLIARSLGCSNFIDIGAHNDWNHYTRETVLNSPIPPPPEFDESIEYMHKSIIKTVGKIPYPSLNIRPHPLITKLLNEDIKRQKEERETGYSWLKARFTDPIQKRKLKLINVIFPGTNSVQISKLTQDKFYESNI